MWIAEYLRTTNDFVYDSETALGTQCSTNRSQTGTRRSAVDRGSRCEVSRFLALRCETAWRRPTSPGGSAHFYLPAQIRKKGRPTRVGRPFGFCRGLCRAVASPEVRGRLRWRPGHCCPGVADAPARCAAAFGFVPRRTFAALSAWPPAPRFRSARGPVRASAVALGSSPWWAAAASSAARAWAPSASGPRPRRSISSLRRTTGLPASPARPILLEPVDPLRDARQGLCGPHTGPAGAPLLRFLFP